MEINKSEIDKMERRYRANVINSITGVKPANLIGTRSSQGQDNVAIFSSAVHLGSNPAQMGLVTRPQVPTIKDTYSNIIETGFYTINHISSSFIKKAHYTSARLDHNDSEFDAMNLEREFIGDFFAPFVKESQVKVGMQFLQNINLPNGCMLIIGEVVNIQIDDEALIADDGSIDLSSYDAVGISGLNSYYELKKLASFPYAKRDQLPNFYE